MAREVFAALQAEQIAARVNAATDCPVCKECIKKTPAKLQQAVFD